MNYYEILGINNNASKSDVRRAYIQMAKKHHPDVNKSPDAKNMFQGVVEAYQVLSEEDLREEYDYILKHGKQSGHLGSFESRVATIRELAALVAHMRFYKALKTGLAGTGAGAGLSAGAYFGARAGGIPGAIIGGIVGGIAGGIGGGTIGKLVESKEYRDVKRIINENLFKYIDSQPDHFKRGISEIMVMNWKHPDIEEKGSFIKNMIFGNKQKNSYYKDNDIILVKSANHVDSLIRNNATFDVIAQYLTYIKKYGSRNDVKLFRNAFMQNDDILKMNESKVQKILTSAISRLETRIDNMQASLSNNGNTEKGVHIAVSIITTIIFLILIFGAKQHVLSIILSPFVFLMYVGIHKGFVNRKNSLQKNIEKSKEKLSQERAKLYAVYSKLRN